MLKKTSISIKNVSVNQISLSKIKKHNKKIKKNINYSIKEINKWINFLIPLINSDNNKYYN